MYYKLPSKECRYYKNYSDIHHRSCDCIGVYKIKSIEFSWKSGDTSCIGKISKCYEEDFSRGIKNEIPCE
jgi:hypothetical protein